MWKCEESSSRKTTLVKAESEESTCDNIFSCAISSSPSITFAYGKCHALRTSKRQTREKFREVTLKVRRGKWNITEQRGERIRTLKGSSFAPKCLYVRIEGTIVSALQGRVKELIKNHRERWVPLEFPLECQEWETPVVYDEKCKCT